MLYLFDKKIILFGSLIAILMLAFNTESSAQRKLESLNYAEFKPKPYYFGLALGYAHNNYRVARSKDFILNNDYNLIGAKGGPGFTIGVIGNLKIGDYFDVRFIPGFSFSGRELAFSAVGEDLIKTENIESTFLEVPFMVRFKSAPYSDMRIFLSAGVKYTYDISSTSRMREEKIRVQLSPHDYLLEAGVGVQFFFPYFILSPEIKFSHGLDNILIYDRSITRSRIIEQLLTQAISISFSFEG